MKTWGSDGSGIMSFIELKQRPCVEEDFKVDEATGVSSYGFFDLHETTKMWTTFHESFKCIDEPYDVYGDYNSNAAGNLMVVFDKCDPAKQEDGFCKSEKEIAEWLEFKYILI